ncbi:MAG TPA: alpha/beta hydrolase, partial [Longimicrobium sp.]|nr:alpha/beta hydrolase [Longimicrobium sp.]
MQFALVRALTRLPPGMQYALSGSPPIQRDGLTLHPEIQLILALRRRARAKGMSALEPVAGRVNLRKDALAFSGPPLEVGAVRDFVLPATSLPARHYAPVDRSTPGPLLVFFHGGGFVLGDLETHDGLCRLLCREAGLHVLSVEYRLAPEAPFPAGLEDARAAFLWAVAHAAELGVDPARVGVGGDSAGGNLAAVISQQCTREGTVRPAAQFLLYPTVDCSVFRPSSELFAEGFFLTRADITWFKRHYVGPSDPKD